jgi:hypothetical protein
MSTSKATSTSNKSVPVLCIYRVKDGKEPEFRALLDRHGPTLAKLGLATGEMPRIWRSKTRSGKVVFVELFEWKDAKSVDVAHQSPELMQVWEPMGALTEDMEFLDVEAIGPTGA